MKDKFILFFRQITLIAILLAPIFSFSQAKQTETVIDSTMAVKPKTIQVLNVIQKIEETNEYLKLTEKKIKPHSSIIQIDSVFPIYVLVIKKQKKSTENFIKSNPNRQKIINLINKWEGYHGHLDTWESTVNNY